MPYIPHTQDEIKQMLKEIGVASVDELFADIPAELRFHEKEPFPGRSENEVVREMTSILGQNKTYPMFLGAGCYNHYVPAAVRAIISRSEFFTSYTQYQLDIEKLKSAVNKNTCMVYMESPNFFGVIDETAPEVSKIAHEAGSLFVFGTDMLSLSVLRSPADLGVDIVIGDAQSLGNPVSFGGSQLGVIACRKEYVRDMPGRLVGETHDVKGKQGFVLTLQTREQHIRRQKAT